MFSIKALFAAAVVILSASGVMADHYLTVVNGCKLWTVAPTLKLLSGKFDGAKSVSVAPGKSYVFKLTDNNALSGSIYNANNGTSSSSLIFSFAASPDNVPASASYALSNYGGFTIPQIVAAWPPNSGCATKRCHTSTATQNNCDSTQAIGKGVTSQSAVNAATETCRAPDTGITLYYCSSLV